MEFKISTETSYYLDETKCIRDEILSKDFRELKLNIILDANEFTELIYNLINNKTGIDLNEYGIKTSVDRNGEICLDIEHNDSLTDKEKEYLGDEFKRIYGINSYYDILNNIMLIHTNGQEEYEIIFVENEPCLLIKIPIEHSNTSVLFKEISSI